MFWQADRALDISEAENQVLKLAGDMPGLVKQANSLPLHSHKWPSHNLSEIVNHMHKIPRLLTQNVEILASAWNAV